MNLNGRAVHLRLLGRAVGRTSEELDLDEVGCWETVKSLLAMKDAAVLLGAEIASDLVAATMSLWG